MANWNTLSVAQVMSEGGFSLTEKNQLTTVAGTGGAALAEVLANAVQTIRGKCRAAGVTLGAADTIPDSLRMEAVAIIRWRWLIGFPALKSLQTDERKLAAENADEMMKGVVKGTIPVEPPEEDDDTAPRGGNWNSNARIALPTDGDRANDDD